MSYKAERWGHRTAGPTGTRAGNPAARNELHPKAPPPGVMFNGKWTQVNITREASYGPVSKALTQPWRVIRSGEWVYLIWLLPTGMITVDRQLVVGANTETKEVWWFVQEEHWPLGTKSHTAKIPLDVENLDEATRAAAMGLLSLNEENLPWV